MAAAISAVPGPRSNSGIPRPDYIPVIEDDTVARTLKAGDSGAILYFTNAGAITLTVPAGLGRGFEVGIVQGGAGQITPTAGAGVTINNRQSFTQTAGQWAFCSLSSPVDDLFVLAGDAA